MTRLSDSDRPDLDDHADGFTRVLFVDDEALMRRAFKRSVSVGHIEVDVAGSGHEALELARERSYSVVVADLRMPGMDGITLIQRLRLLNPDAEYMLLTATPPNELSLSPESQDGVGAVLQKPCDAMTLLGAVTRAAEVGLQPSAAHSPRLLIAEDDPAERELLLRHVKKITSTAPTVVSDLEAAVRSAHDDAFDLILFDLTLPDAVGLESIRRLITAAPNAALVALSDFDDEDLAARALQLGAQEVIDKGSISQGGLARRLRFALERASARERLAHLAHYDQLTGLANRTMLRNRLNQALATCRRSGERFAVIYIDLDDFKPVNDTYGHDVGDQLLQEVASRLAKCIRPSDLVARIGGDEFAIVIDRLGDSKALTGVLDRLCDGLTPHATLDSLQVPFGASIGVAVYPDTADSISSLLRRADLAMYAAKSTPGVSWVLGDPDASSRRFAVPARLPRATLAPTGPGAAENDNAAQLQLPGIGPRGASRRAPRQPGETCTPASLRRAG